MVAFPAVARIAADRQPIAPEPAVTLEPPAPRGPGLQPLLAEPAPERLAELRPAAVALLGETLADRFLALVRTRTREPEFDYTYPEFRRLLPSGLDPAAATRLGTRLVLLEEPAPSAGIAAYVLFDRARAGGGCAPHLNLLLLHAAEIPQSNGERTTEVGRRAVAACPRDPTAGWLLALYTSVRDPSGALPDVRQLRRTFPGSAAAWSAEADVLVRLAYVRPPERRFVIRHLFERALAGYQRAIALGGPRAELELGVARALDGLGRADDAVTVQRRAMAASPRTAQLQSRLLEYLEAGRRFPEATAAAFQLRTMAGAAAPGPDWFPQTKDHLLEGITNRDADWPISIGAGRRQPLSVFLGHGAVLPMADALDFSFIPPYRERPGITGSEPWCPEWAFRRNLLLAGRAAAARANLPRAFTPIDPRHSSCKGSPAMIAGLAALELGEDRSARLHEERQNVWRWAGDLERAAAAAREWSVQFGTNLMPRIRRGEIAFLRERYDEAARHFDAAARIARERARDTQWEAEALVKRGAALVAARRDTEAIPVLRHADEVAMRASEDSLMPYAWSNYANAQLGDALRRQGELRAAADAYAATDAEYSTPTNAAAVALNAAVVEIGLDHPRAAVSLMRRALRVDPDNPLFLMTAGYAADRSGDTAGALKLYRGALWADRTLYPAANEIGVLLARQGRDEEAVAALRRAVGANEQYALGWFNLGVVLGGMGVRHLPASQGALAKAFALDPKLRDRKREPTTDGATYRTRLDLSRPLPAEWSFAATQRSAPEKTIGLAAVLLLAFGLARTLGSTGSGRGLADTWLGRLADATGRLRLPGPLRHPLVAVLTTVAVLLWPLARDPSGGWTQAAAGVFGVAVLIAVALRARAAVARRAGEQGAQESWAPGVAFGLGTAAAGFTWAPLPVLREAGARLHWAAPVALACVALPLVVMTAWLDIPLTRALAAAALVMAASLLTPVKPVDGGAISAAGGTAAGLTGLGLAALLLLGLV